MFVSNIPFSVLNFSLFFQSLYFFLKHPFFSPLHISYFPNPLEFFIFLKILLQKKRRRKKNPAANSDNWTMEMSMDNIWFWLWIMFSCFFTCFLNVETQCHSLNIKHLETQIRTQNKEMEITFILFCLFQIILQQWRLYIRMKGI